VVSKHYRHAEQRLEELVDRAEAVGLRLSFDELRELARLYRASSAHLAMLRSRASDADAIRYLNALCVRAYTHLQIAPARERGLARFFTSDLPATLGATAWIQLLAAAILLTGALAGVMLVSHNPATLYACVPAWMYPPDRLEMLADSAQERAHFLAHAHLAFGFKSVFSAGLFVNNFRIGLLCFASGILAGVPTLLLLFYNGVILGSFAWIFSRDGSWPSFWAWLLPHAIPELLAVILCSTAGLLLGAAVVAPGRRGVVAAVRAAARPALELVMASIPLLIVAAGIESFVRQSMLPNFARFALAAAAVAAIGWYVAYIRRLARMRPPPDLEWLIRRSQPVESPGIDSTPAR
jgi:uncharacterized membrane protein SpoIIM required for sporulation